MKIEKGVAPQTSIYIFHDPKFEGGLKKTRKADGKPTTYRARYDWAKLDVFDSTVVRADQKQNARVSIFQFASRRPGWHYSSRTQNDGSVRFWRTA
jgi:hypothetical protein